MINVTKKRMEMLHRGPMNLEDAAVLILEEKRRLQKLAQDTNTITAVDQQDPDKEPAVQDTYESPNKLIKYSTVTIDAGEGARQTTESKA